MQNQRGFMSAAVLITIVLGLIVVGGGAYYIEHQQTISQYSSEDNFNNVRQLPPTNTQTSKPTQATTDTPKQTIQTNTTATAKLEVASNSSSDLYNYAGGNYELKYADFNFDGLQDKVTVPDKNDSSDTYRGARPHKDVYLQTVSGQYILSDELTKLINGTKSLKIDGARKRIISYGSGSCCMMYGVEYEVIPPDDLREVFTIIETTQDTDVPSGKIKVTRKTLVNGSWQTSVDFYDSLTYKYWNGN